MQNEKNPPIIFFNSEKQISYPMYLCVSVVNSIWNGLGFFCNNIGLARVYGMHFSKKRSWRAVLMTIPDNHKMA